MLSEPKPACDLSFATCDDGAITVDWVVVTALVVVMALSVAGVVGSGVLGLSARIETDLIEARP